MSRPWWARAVTRAPLDLVALADHQHVGAGLVDLERRLRHRQQRLRGALPGSPDAQELRLDQHAVGVWQLAARTVAVSVVLVDLHVEEVPDAGDRIACRSAALTRMSTWRALSPLACLADLHSRLALLTGNIT